jgi:gas vesicle protein
MDNLIRTTGANSPSLAELIPGLLVGVLTGFCIVILIAPHSGSITRNKIEQKSTQTRKWVVDMYSELSLLFHFDKRKILFGTRENTQDW